MQKVIDKRVSFGLTKEHFKSFGINYTINDNVLNKIIGFNTKSNVYEKEIVEYAIDAYLWDVFIKDKALSFESNKLDSREKDTLNNGIEKFLNLIEIDDSTAMKTAAGCLKKINAAKKDITEKDFIEIFNSFFLANNVVFKRIEEYFFDISDSSIVHAIYGMAIYDLALKDKKCLFLADQLYAGEKKNILSLSKALINKASQDGPTFERFRDKCEEKYASIKSVEANSRLINLPKNES